MLRLLLDHGPGHEVPALAAVGDLPRPLAGGHPDAGLGRRRPARVGRAEERTPYGFAWRLGRPDLCELLAELGARREIGPVDELIGLCFAGDRKGAQRLAAEHPDRVERIAPSSPRRFTRPRRRAGGRRWRSCWSSASRSAGPGRWAARRCTTRRGGATTTWSPHCLTRALTLRPRGARDRRHRPRLDRPRLVPLSRPRGRRRHRAPQDRLAAGAGGRRDRAGHDPRGRARAGRMARGAGRRTAGPD